MLCPIDNHYLTFYHKCLQVHKRSEYARKALGLKGKMFAKKRHQEKALLKKTIAMHEEKEQKHKADDGAPQNAVPAYLLERDQVCLCCCCWWLDWARLDAAARQQHSRLCMITGSSSSSSVSQHA
jgi:hypothetical protein